MPYVKDVMKKEIIVAKIHEPIQHISKLLTEKKISNIPVINGRGSLIGIVSEQDIIRAMESEDFMKLTAKDIMTGVAKSFVFGGIIDLIGCYYGLNTSGGAEGVGKSTTTSIVTSFILIIVSDCILTAIFFFTNV